MNERRGAGVARGQSRGQEAHAAAPKRGGGGRAAAREHEAPTAKAKRGGGRAAAREQEAHATKPKRGGEKPAPSPKPQRADARRNQAALLDAAAAVFVASGVEAPIRDIAARAGVGTATIYRHFPTRADLIIAVYRHQVEALAEAGPALLGDSITPHAALARWIDLFVDFLVTKLGLAAVLQSDDPCFDPLHSYFLERLGPVCARLLDAAAAAGEIQPGQDPFELMRGVGGLCAGAGNDSRYDARRLVGHLIAGLRLPH